MRPSLFWVEALLIGAASATPSDTSTPSAAPRIARALTEPFLTQIDNETWVIGNELWNMTQQRTYGVKLMYKGRDLVGSAVGHYVSYSL